MANTHQNISSVKKIFTTLAIALLIVGAAYGIWFGIQKHSASEALKSSDLGNASSQSQSAAERSVQNFLDNVRRHEYVQALQFTTNTYPSPHSAQSLEKRALGELSPLITASTLSFDPAHIAVGGQKIYLRASLQSDGKPYRTVCSLVNEKGAWRISNIHPPVTVSKPPIAAIMGGKRSR